MARLFIKSLLVFCLLTFCWAGNSSAQQQQKIITQYEQTKNTAPREKLYVHFDKSVYVSPDTIWFKAYLTNNILDGFKPISEVVYVEIFNAKGERVNSMALPTVLGVSWGAFALNTVDCPPGKYTFRAYTQWMRNFGESLFFSKEITVLPSVIPSKSLAGAKLNSTVTKPTSLLVRNSEQDIDFQFLPEGGTWLAGIVQKMAFKVLSPSGKGVAVAGTIVDSKAQKVAEFKSNNKGMGYFTMLPLKGEVYTAKLLINDAEVVKILPKAVLNGTALAVDLERTADSIDVILSSTLPGEEFTIVGQSKGLLCFTAALRTIVGKKSLRVTKDVFPTGVSQIIVLNEKGEAIHERNFFLNFNDQLNLSLTTPHVSYNSRDSIPMRLKVSDAAGIPVSGSFSVSITDDGQVEKDSVNDANILSYLLISSDLKGEIEDAGYYFHQTNVQTTSDLDVLMLTQGWVSYDWDSEKPLPFKAEKEFTISGKIDNVLNKPIPKAKVVMAGQNKTFLVLDTLSNSQGEFVFDKLPILDSASFVIQATTLNNKRGTLAITLNETKQPVFTLNAKKNEMANFVMDSVDVEYITSKRKANEFGLQQGIALREVEIVGNRVIKGSKNLNGPGKSSQTLGEKELAPFDKRTLYYLLIAKVKGFNERKKDFFINANNVKFIIDGFSIDLFYDPQGSTLGYEVDYVAIPDEDIRIYEYKQHIKGYLDYFKAEDIKGIEVMESGYSYRYRNQFINLKSDYVNLDVKDSKNFNFIEITTKTGQGPFLKKAANLYLTKPMNYGSNKVFYHPKYTILNKMDQKPDLRSTLYWNPNMITKNDGTIDFSFFAADRKGTYTIWIEGMDMEGRVGMKTVNIKIN